MSPSEVAARIVDNGGVTVRRISSDYLIPANDAGIYVGLDKIQDPILDVGDVVKRVADWSEKAGPSPYLGFWLQREPSTVLHCDRVAILPNRNAEDVAYATAEAIVHGQEEVFLRLPNGNGCDVSLRKIDLLNTPAYAGHARGAAWYDCTVFGHWHVIRVHAVSVLAFGHRKADRTSWVYVGFREHLEPVPIDDARLCEWWRKSKAPRCVKVAAERLLSGHRNAQGVGR